ncbi:MAG TPA: porin PorA family protein [Candidatus Nitrosotalea sp.]|nr:porin PorA family protein [Candidatus Nitrosotalea sp.]
MNFKTKLVIGVLTIIFVLITYGLFVNEVKKLPINYEFISEQEGKDRLLNSPSGNLSAPFGIRETLRENVINTTGDILEINSTILGKDPVTNNIVFYNAHTFFVDRTTRKIQPSNEYFTFPANVQKNDYVFFHPMIFSKTPFVFDKIDYINGLEVYDFSCKYNEVDVSSSHPQFPSSKILSDGGCRVSVEPATGITVFFSKQWDDYFVNNGVKGADVEIGEKHTTAYSENILVDTAKSTKTLYYFLDLVFPSLIATVGITILFVVLLFDKTKNQAKIIIHTQNEMIKKEKLSAIGELTAKLSHDLRNPISVISLTIQAIEMRIHNKLDPKLNEYLPIINEEISRINHQINQVLGFVKTRPLNKKLVSVSNILADSIRNINIPKNISIILPEKDFTLMADKIQMSVAFTNILLNAIDEIGENEGKITIRSSNEKNNLIMEFEDSGDGIPKENINKIFEPLFTTKQTGTGLGLSSVLSIIESHGGSISVRSPPTIFRIILPQN